MSDKGKPIVIDAPHVPPAEAGPRDAESRAVASHPEFQAMIAKGRRNRAAAKGLSAAEVFSGLDTGGAVAPSPSNGAGTTGHQCDEADQSPAHQVAAASLSKPV